MGTLLAFIIFPTALAVLIVATHYLLRSAGNLGVVLGISPFIVGAFIVALGTSLPEASVALFSAWHGLVGVPVAQTVGSNIANILLVLGISVLLVRNLSITRNLINVEIPLITAVTLLFVFVVFDGTVNAYEGVFLLLGLACYVVYVFYSEDNRSYPLSSEEKLQGLSFVPKWVGVFLAALIFIVFSSQYVIQSLETLAHSFSVPEEIIALTALALGTSLPEIVVSIQAALRNEIEVVVGNVIGSNIFNILLVIGLPALITTLTVDSTVLFIGVPALVGATILFVISGISNKIHLWEGLFYILLYMVLVGKIVGIL